MIQSSGPSTKKSRKELFEFQQAFYERLNSWDVNGSPSERRQKEKKSLCPRIHLLAESEK